MRALETAFLVVHWPALKSSGALEEKLREMARGERPWAAALVMHVLRAVAAADCAGAPEPAGAVRWHGRINEDSDEDALSLVEASDNEDLISLDGDVPEGLIEYDGSDAESEAAGEAEWTGFDGGAKKRKREDTQTSRRKKLRSLPTFASYEDYAKMIEDTPEDNI